MKDSIRTGKHPALLNAAAACCLFAILLVCYYQGFNGPFMLDDITSVLPAQIDALSIAEFARVVDGENSGLLVRAIPAVSFALNNYLSDGSAFGFKISNFILHAITTIAVYAVLTRIFTVLNQRQNSFTELNINKLALFCTAVWALHPLQISTVLYVVQRMAMFSALFNILALWFYLTIRTSVQTGTTRSIMLLLLGVSILAACFSKDTGVLAFVYIGFVELLVLRFRKPDGQLLTSYRRVFLVTAALGILVVVYLMFHLHTQLLYGYVVRDYGVPERLMTEPGVLLMYLKLVLLPNIADMSLFHDTYPIVRQLGLPTFIPAVILLLLCVVALLLRHRYPILLFGVGFFLISHSIESTFLPLELVFEHRNYLAMIGVIAPVAWMLMLAVTSIKLRLPIKLIMTAVLALLAFQTYTRSIEWSDTELFYRQAMIEQPTSIRALNNWTAYLSSQGLNSEIIAHLEYSHRIRPDSPHFLIQLLMYSGAINGPNEQLLNQVRNQMAIYPLKIDEISALQEMYRNYHEKRIEWPDSEVITSLYATAAIDSEKLLKSRTESLLFRQYSSLLYASGQKQNALSAARRAVELDRSEPESLLHLAQMQLKVNQVENTANTLQQLSVLDRDNQFISERNIVADEIRRLSTAEIEN